MMKKSALLLLFLCSSSFAQKQISLKDLGSIDYDKTYDELSSKKDENIYSKIQESQYKAAEKELKNKKNQKKALWENSTHNPNRKNSFGK